MKKKATIYRTTAKLLALLISFQAAFPNGAMALTSGPTQPELQSFEPVATTEMVDLFSGDFSYNIPLMVVPGPNGGYPINLFYNSITESEAEASMVGLGWNIGIGAINRGVQGLPDDFNGELIRRKKDLKPNWTAGLGADINFEFFGADTDKLPLASELSLGVNFMYNSYKGYGYSFMPEVNILLGNKKAGENSLGVSTSFGLDINSLTGVSANANISLGEISKGQDEDLKYKSKIGLGIGTNSRTGITGLNYVEVKHEKKSELSGSKTITSTSNKNLFNNVTSSLTTETPAFSPTVSMPTIGLGLNANFKLGIDILGGFANFNAINGFYSEQRLANRNSWVSSPAFGYLYSQNYKDFFPGQGIMDFSRSNDGLIRENQPNLAVPRSTPDILSVTGHGIGGMIRANRSDIGIYRDQVVSSASGSGSISIDLGPGPNQHLGVDINISGGNSSDNYVDNNFGIDFQKKVNESLFEPYYYKAYGEMTADLYSEANSPDFNTANDEPVRLKRNGLGFGDEFEFRMPGEDNLYNELIIPNNGRRADRKARSSTIHSFTNSQLVRGQGDNLLPSFDISYFPISNGANVTDYSTLTTETLNRPTTNKEGDKIGGYTYLATGGYQWTYALPAINHIKKSVGFSVDHQGSACNPIVAVPTNTETNCNSVDINHKTGNTDEYLNIEETPSYAHSYFLTSIQGPDYVDVTENGFTNDDSGYWMEIEYLKTNDKNNPYKWRAPFVGATFMEGFNNKAKDDKAQFLYGERDQYYPAKIKSKTHVAEFYYSTRQDAHGAACWIQNPNDPTILGASSYKLDSIRLFVKNYPENILIKTVQFKYADNSSEELCLNSENTTSGRGKLTLKELSFTYQENNRGRLSPYKFNYYNEGDNTRGYSHFTYDRWGAYRANELGNPCSNIDFPYVKQSGSNLESDLADEVRSWHIKEIQLPSGAKINVDIERDHYAYVQDRTATQMFEIQGFETYLNSNIPNSAIDVNSDDLKVYFDLETPISSSVQLQADLELDRYFEDLFETENGKQIYFKLHTDLVNNGVYEDVNGFAIIDDWGFGVAQNGEYSNAWVKLLPFPQQIGSKDYHPMIVPSWQFLKINIPDLMFGYDPGEQQTNNSGFKKTLYKLGAVWGELGKVFSKYYKHCSKKDYAKNVDRSKSFIRLNSPDKKKYGGGIRVSKVTLDDDWIEEETPIYGTVYEYETEEKVPYYNTTTQSVEETTRLISSGVATNEPSVGNDETALSYAKTYKEDFRLRQDNLFFFVQPANEAYMPSASVGYSKVTVKSLASQYAINDNLNLPTPVDLGVLDPGFANSGYSVHEFYTAHDFPIITEETDNDDRTNPQKMVYWPLIGFSRINRYMGSQGYSVEVNNMHGKPQKVSTYGLDAMGGVIPVPISWVKYEYQFDTEVYQLGEKRLERKRLNNTVDVLLGTLDQTSLTTADMEKAEMGVEREFFLDIRESTVFNGKFGIDANVDAIGVGPISIPVTGPWPEVDTYEARVRTAVTNKIIHKSGILKKTVAKDGQSEVETENLVFDRYTGQALLASVTNNFDKPIYNYTIPAHLAYEGMGPAYQNIGLCFDIPSNNFSGNSCKLIFEISGIPANTVEDLVPGDRFVISETNDNSHKNIATFIREDNGLCFFEIKDIVQIIDNAALTFEIIQSGRKNHMDAVAGNIIALQNPTQDIYAQSACNVDVEIPDVPVSETIQSRISQVNGVLSANAVVYSDVWFGKASCDSEIYVSFELFENKSFIWKPKQFYTYVNDRKYETDNIEYEQSGKMDDVVMFDWRNPFVLSCNESSNWVKTSEITKYNHDYIPVEEKNAAGIYSAVHYPYGVFTPDIHESLPSTVGNNTSYYEMAHNNFENYINNPLEEFDAGNLLVIDCSSGYYASTYTKAFNIIGGYRDDNKILIDMAFDQNFLYGSSSITLDLLDEYGEKILLSRIGLIGASNSNGMTELELDFADTDNSCDFSPGTNVKTGRVILNNCQVLVHTCNNVSITDAYAHTGKKSLEVIGDNKRFQQIALKLIQGKTYTLSGWVRRANDDVASYADNVLGINIWSNSAPGPAIISPLIQPSGPIINGWQRFEGTFAFDTNMEIAFSTGAIAAYFDDLRIHPETANIQAFLYDPVFSRLTESLDQNNFYTQYLYDSQGNLISTRKETKDGIKTLQEVQSYQKSTASN